MSERLRGSPPGRPFLDLVIHQILGKFELEARLEVSSAWTVLFGPSGAGKTSLLRVIAGLQPPEAKSGGWKRKPACSGVIRLNQRTLMDSTQGIWIPPGERRIGFVTQRPALFPHLDATGNAAFGIRNCSKHERQQRALAALRLCAAESLAGRKPAALSGGERQRVALARALAPQPEMVLLDEPFTGLDGALKEEILGNLSAWLSERKIPALYVSHDLAEVFQTSADVIVLRDGRLQAQGKPEAVLAAERDRLLHRLHGTASPAEAARSLP